MREDLQFDNRVITIMEQLQDWIDDFEELSTRLIVQVIFTKYFASIQIGDFVVWNNEDGLQDLTFEYCKNEFKKELEELRPFMDYSADHP